MVDCANLLMVYNSCKGIINKIQNIRQSFVNNSFRKGFAIMDLDVILSTKKIILQN